ncbi:hypothetical protein BJ973_002581 [Actinoplanes tereljensis]|uniref:Uncharacterized protein n=1 Tax=Paractinoplanes tereljensis TaxID=571912 RepID=A0A919NRG7_9ACTN|nr:hypothetical protein [Actinoplanes tereljensis]GIF22257.1 hypothetical protein Ate02nite_49870 [Actinoplanes tereljensis]
MRETTTDHRALLAAYPARLRRRHGAELIGTMLELAAPGRPSRSDRWHLITDGLRARFRLPTGRPVARLIAVLALLIGGGLGAAAGSWAGMWTFPALPSPATLATQTMGNDATPADTAGGRLWLNIDGHLTTGTDATVAAQRARDRLTAAGWTTTTVVVSGGTDGRFRRAAFEADSGGTRLDVRAYYDDSGLVSIAGRSLPPLAYLPLVLGGMLLGMLIGWLLAADLAYRITGAGRRRTSGLLAISGTALTLLLLPAASVYAYLLRYPRISEAELVHRALTSGPAGLWPWFPAGQPASNKVLLIAGLTTAAITAILARTNQADPAALAPPQPG